MKKKYICLSISVSFVIISLTINGCCLFGIKGKPPKVQPVKEVSVSMPMQAEQAQIRVVDENQLKQEKNDVIQEIKTKVDDSQAIGSVNWSKGYIKAIGYGLAPPNVPSEAGKALAREAAYAVALSNLLGTIKGVNVTSKTTVENLMLKEQRVVNVVEGIIKGAILLNEGYQEKDGTITAFVEVGIILDDLSSAIPKSLPGLFETEKPLKESIKPKPTDSIKNMVNVNADNQSVGREIKEPNPKNEIEKPKENVIEAEKAQTEKYTGIVIDAQRLNVVKALYPKVYSKENNEYKAIYGNESYPGKQVSLWMEWAQNPEDAKKHDRVSSNPIIIKAIGVSEDGDPVIDAKDAEKIESLEKEYKFLENGKIVTII